MIKIKTIAEIHNEMTMSEVNMPDEGETFVVLNDFDDFKKGDKFEVQLVYNQAVTVEFKKAVKTFNSREWKTLPIKLV